MADGSVKIRVPIKMWLNDIEDEALKQLINLANLPFVFKHICAMADAHKGYGMCIGGVLATINNIIIPNAVGKDIGCGMVAVKTSLTEIGTDALKAILERIRKTIPVGFDHHKKPQDQELIPYIPIDDLHNHRVIERELASALKQLGTLGSGNHFIEIQKGSDGFIWIMIHSGSRNLGLQVANHYNNIAIELNKLWYSSVPEKHELAFLPLHTPEGRAYFREMLYCVKFALANRKLMMERTKLAMKEQFPSIEFDSMINIAHNYAAMENHFGKNVIVHRKGATRAYEGELGIIPGSQGSNSYIVRGKGCKDSFMSCSHGAGRSMSITEAIKTLSFDDEVSKLDKLGTLHTIRNKDDLGEAEGAYKDISTVMKNQEDLVDIVVKLTPLATIKGKPPRRKKKKDKGENNATKNTP
ncbi:MAG: RtcB family protein [Proteobacteria bacterium]|nr:RtcB family protein [Pseudomonadota bacterium]